MSNLPKVDVLSQEMRELFRRYPVDTRGYMLNRSPSGIALYAIGTIAIVGGLWMVGKHNKRKRAVKQEERDIQIDLLPLLQHKEDAIEYRRNDIINFLEDNLLQEFYTENYASKMEPVWYAPSWNLWDRTSDTRYISRRSAPH